MSGQCFRLESSVSLFLPSGCPILGLNDSDSGPMGIGLRGVAAAMQKEREGDRETGAEQTK